MKSRISFYNFPSFITRSFLISSVASSVLYSVFLGVGLGAVATGSLVGCSTASKTTEAVVPAPTAPALPSSIDEAVASQYRRDENRARDQYRHPAETLKFFGLKPDMTVVELNPSGGWYLEILAPLLATSGHYVAATAVGGEHGGDKSIATYETLHPNLASKIEVANFNPPEHSSLVSDGTADMVLTFRNVHNWMMDGKEKDVFAAVYKALKPGGVFGVVEHRAGKKTKNSAKGMAGYVQEKVVIALAQTAGFKLDQKSDINANPKDTKNYENGVWTLPPSLRDGDKNRAKYIAIGESDRMTLRFVKPLKK